MHRWVIRGVSLAVTHAAAQTALAAVAVRQPEFGGTLRLAALAAVLAVALVWGVVDGRRGLPVQGLDWFFAALVAGPLAGLLGVVAQAVLVDQTGIEALGSALTGGAAFTALLVLVPAAVGLLVGGLLRHGAPPDQAAPGQAAPDQTSADQPGTLPAAPQRTAQQGAGQPDGGQRA